MIEKYSVCGLPPQEDAIFVEIQWSHMLEHGKPGSCAARAVIRPNPLFGYQSQRGRGLSFVVYFIGFFSVQCQIMLQNK